MEITPRAFRRYLLLMGGLAGGFLGLVAAVNYFVDPYDYFGRNMLGVYVYNEEIEYKRSGMDRYPERSILLGDSKEDAMDVTKVPGTMKFFNAGFGFALPEQVLEMAKRVSPEAPLVLVGLDYFQYNSARPFMPVPLPPRNVTNALNYLLSSQALMDSYRSIAGSLRHKRKTFLPDGSFDTSDWVIRDKQYDPVVLARIFDLHEQQARDFRLSPDRVATLPLLRQALDARHKPYLVFINPLVAEDWRRMERAGMLPVYEQWNARVHAAFPEVIDLARSKYSDPAYFFILDPVHFHPETGAKIINDELLPRVKWLEASPAK